MNVYELVLRIFAQSLNIVFSWGFHSPMAIENGIIFHCNGFRFAGKVKVTLTPLDVFKVELISSDGAIVETIDDVYIDSLVDVIDSHVEKVDNYEERVKQEYLK